MPKQGVLCLKAIRKPCSLTATYLEVLLGLLCDLEMRKNAICFDIKKSTFKTHYHPSTSCFPFVPLTSEIQKTQLSATKISGAIADVNGKIKNKNGGVGVGVR